MKGALWDFVEKDPERLVLLDTLNIFNGKLKNTIKTKMFN